MKKRSGGENNTGWILHASVGAGGESGVGPFLPVRVSVAGLWIFCKISETNMQKTKFSPTTKDIALLHQLQQSGQLKLQPEFQRNSVWPRAAKAYLIDTILLHRGQ